MRSQNRPFRLAVVTSHPIEYQGPLFQYIAKNFSQKIDLTVYFCWDFGVKETYEPAFATSIKWDFPILEGYNHKFLKNFSPKPTSSNFLGEINPGIIFEILKGKYDAVLVMGWSFLTDWFAFFAAFLSGTPILLRGENPLPAELKKAKWKIGLKKKVLGWLFKRIGAFLYIGEENKKFYKFYGASDNKLFFTPYAVNNDKFMSDAEELRPKKTELKKSLGFEPDQVVVLFAGKLIEKKRPLDLLKSFEILNSKFKIRNSSLVFMGDGPLKGKILEVAKEEGLKNVHVTGFVGQTEIKNYYALADIFVLPSDERETWGMVVNEAMCFSLPIVVSDLVGCGTDLVLSGENGYRFGFGDAEKLAERLEELVNNKEKREKFGAKSSEIVKEYSYEKDVNGILRSLDFLDR